MRRTPGSAATALAALIAALLLGGCSSFSVPTVEPWVKPYERDERSRSGARGAPHFRSSRICLS